MICDPVDHIIVGGLVFEGLVMFAIGMRAYRAADKAYEEALSILKQIISLRDAARVERDKWKFAKILSDATNKGDIDETHI
jgi:hypothetical protein